MLPMEMTVLTSSDVKNPYISSTRRCHPILGSSARSRAQDLGIKYVFQKVENKLEIFENLLKELDLSMLEISDGSFEMDQKDKLKYIKEMSKSSL